MNTTATRYHDLSVGHRVFRHESKCAHLHGHNYRIHFTVQADKLDPLGRVLDFGDIKRLLCEWLEVTWDHRFLLWNEDPLADDLVAMDPQGVILVPFNPTAENMAEFLLSEVGPSLLPAHVQLVSVVVEETRKCSVEARRFYKENE